MIAGAQPAQMALLRQYAGYVGVAFQIQDDVLNLESDQARYGKELEGDLAEGKRTLVLLHMLRSATPDEQANAQRILELPRQDKSKADIAYVVDLIHRSGSLGYARGVAQQLALKAERILTRTYDWLPPSIHRDFIADMAGHVITRDR
jgi:geranylgeranyl diphosphate synthase type II